ncbi:hypothetical protein F511_18320 [Dorcoceras hygrometricum]|uniref:Uncharacterized protein n=1 Tax=Dorcoceras hygrometricum TaxID=472368 RepID=A0A2Z7CTD2_9LAMI|nr:hypothetical protein F511_18320 [Dorcoceras hygrometricum]
MGTEVDQLYHCPVQPGNQKILQMGDTDPRHKNRKQNTSPSQLGGRHSNPVVTTPMIALDFSGTTQRSASHNVAPNQVPTTRTKLKSTRKSHPQAHASKRNARRSFLQKLRTLAAPLSKSSDNSKSKIGHFAADCNRPRKDDRYRRDNKKDERHKREEEDDERTVERSKDKSKDKFKDRSKDRRMKIKSDKRPSRRNDRKALNDMVHEYKTLSHTFEEIKAENASLKNSSAESSSDELEDTDSLKTELSKLRIENELLRSESSELKAEVEKLTKEMSSWTQSARAFHKLQEIQKSAHDRTGLADVIYDCCESIRYDDQKSSQSSHKGKGKDGIGYQRPESSKPSWLKNRLDKDKAKADYKSYVPNQQWRNFRKAKYGWKKTWPRRDPVGQNVKSKLHRSHNFAKTFVDPKTRKTVKIRQSGPRPEGRILRQPALEGLTRSTRTDSPRKTDRSKSDQSTAGGGQRREAAAAAAAWEERERGRPCFWVRVKELNNIGYPRMSASGESSTTMHRLLHASGPHPIPPPNDLKTNQYNQDLGLIHSTSGNHLESPNEGSSIDHQVTIHLHAQNITMFPTNETWYFASQMLVSSSGGLILVLTAQSTRNVFRIHSDY